MKVEKHKALNLLKLSPGEFIVCIQRKHWSTLVEPLLLPLLLLALLVGFTIFLHAQTQFVISAWVWLLLSHLYLLVIAACVLFETYLYLFWYYQFYIVTNKRIVHRRHFTLGGRHIDEVFLDATPIKEIIREASSILSDVLHDEDVYVYFQRLERPEPFIFRQPAKPRELEVVMEHAAVKKFEPYKDI